MRSIRFGGCSWACRMRMRRRRRKTRSNCSRTSLPAGLRSSAPPCPLIALESPVVHRPSPVEFPAVRSHSPSRSVRLSRRGTVQRKWHATAVRSNRSVFPVADPRRRRALQPQISTAQKRRSTIGAADDASLEHQGGSVRNLAVPVCAPPLAHSAARPACRGVWLLTRDA